MVGARTTSSPLASSTAPLRPLALGSAGAPTPPPDRSPAPQSTARRGGSWRRRRGGRSVDEGRPVATGRPSSPSRDDPGWRPATNVGCRAMSSHGCLSPRRTHRELATPPGAVTPQRRPARRGGRQHEPRPARRTSVEDPSRGMGERHRHRDRPGPGRDVLRAAADPLTDGGLHLASTEALRGLVEGRRMGLVEWQAVLAPNLTVEAVLATLIGRQRHLRRHTAIRGRSPLPTLAGPRRRRTSSRGSGAWP